MFNGMQNPSFAALKNSQQANIVHKNFIKKDSTPSKYEIPKSFKELA
jgi:hypothetical protein